MKDGNGDEIELYDVVVYDVGWPGPDMNLAILIGGEPSAYQILSRVYGNGDWFEETVSEVFKAGEHRRNERHWQSTVDEAERLKRKSDG